MIDRPTAQKLHKIGYPNMEGSPFENALDIAEERVEKFSPVRYRGHGR